MSKLEKEIKRFFDFIFNDDVYVEEGVDGVFGLDFKKVIAKRDAVLNIARLKKVLNLYLVYNGIEFGKFKINILSPKDKQEYDED
ncbi:MAG: hypothetical protein QXX68_03490 [Candidatus Pacearchaeota archaeon]